MGQSKIKDITLRIFAVIIALFLWVIAMTEDNPIETKFVDNIPVKLVNIDSLAQSGLVFIGDENGLSIKLLVRGRKKDLQALRSENIKAEANIGVGSFIKGKNSIPVEIKDKPSNIEIPDQPMYINLELDELVERSIPVTVQVTPTNMKGYAVLPATVKPDMVTLRGAAQYIGSVKSVVAKVDTNNATSDINVSLPVQILDSKNIIISNKYIECNPRVVDISVPIKRSKDVPINVILNGKLPQGVVLKGEPQAEPAKVLIIGDDDYLNSINSIDTTPISLDGITSNTTKTVKLNIPQGVSIINNVQTVKVSINVESTITKTFNIPVSYINLSDGLKAEILTDNISVTLSGQESKLNSLSNADISAAVDLANAPSEDGEYEFSPKIAFPPEFNFIKADPSKVRVKITKKQG